MRILLILFNATLLVCVASNTGQAASVQWLGAGTAAHGVSADGSVVVGGGPIGTNSSVPFYWTAAEGRVPLSAVGLSSAVAVSSDGAAIAGSDAWVGNYIWGRYWINGIGQTIGPVAGGSNGFVVPWAMSADGAIVVGQSNGPNNSLVGFRWTSETGSVALPRLSTASGSNSATHISSDGSIIYGASVDAQGNSVAVRWTASGISPILDSVGNVIHGSALGASSDGSVIVGGSNSEAYRWSEATGVVGLGKLGQQRSLATDVSADGSVIVGYGSRDSISQDRAFIWTAQGGTQSLSDFLIANGIDVGTWEFRRAQAISDDGRVIVGAGYRDGNDQAFVIAVPEPSSAFAAVLAALALARRTRVTLAPTAR